MIPDFLSKKQPAQGNLKVIWTGYKHIENTLDFGTRKKNIYAKEISCIKEILLKEMA